MLDIMALPLASKIELAKKAQDMGVLAKLASSGNVDIVRQLASNAHIDLNVQDGCLKHPDEQVRFRLAKNPALNAKRLKLLAKDKSPNVRGTVAYNVNVTEEILDMLMLDTDEDALLLLAECPTLPVRLLRQLAHNPSAYVRERVASNRAACVEARVKLASDEEEDVVESLITHGKLCPEVLKVFKDSNDYDRMTRAIERSPITAELFKEVIEEAQEPYTEVHALAINPHLTEDMMHELLEYDEPELMRSLAANTSVTHSTASTLYSFNELAIKKALATNTGTPEPILEWIALDRDTTTALTVLENKNAPKRIKDIVELRRKF